MSSVAENILRVAQRKEAVRSAVSGACDGLHPGLCSPLADKMRTLYTALAEAGKEENDV